MPGFSNADIATRARSDRGFPKRQLDELSVGPEPKLDTVRAATARGCRAGMPIEEKHR